MKKILAILVAITLPIGIVQASCDKCDLEKVKRANEHIDNLAIQIVSDFLCTFDTICTDNAEFSEWSNETLFNVLHKAPLLVFQVVAQGQVDNNAILSEIESPIHDQFNLQAIYDKVKLSDASANTKAPFLKSLIKAAQKEGIKIKE